MRWSELAFFTRWWALIRWVCVLLNLASAIVQFRYMPHTWFHFVGGAVNLAAGGFLAVVTVMLWRSSRRAGVK